MSISNRVECLITAVVNKVLAGYGHSYQISIFFSKVFISYKVECLMMAVVNKVLAGYGHSY